MTKPLYKKSLMLILVMVLVLSVGGIILVSNTQASALTPDTLWKGENFSTQLSEQGTTLFVSLRDNAEARFYNTLPLVYQRDVLVGKTVTPEATKYFDFSFTVTERNFTSLIIKFSDVSNANKNVSLTLVFPEGYSAASPTFYVDVKVDGKDAHRNTITTFGYEPTFNLTYDKTNALFVLSDGLNRFTLEKSAADRRIEFSNDLANMSITFSGHNTSARSAICVHSINEQSMGLVAGETAIKNDILPVIKLANGATTFSLKAGQNTVVTVPFIAVDVLNATTNYIMQIYEPRSNTESLTTVYETKYSVNTFNARWEGLYTVKIYASCMADSASDIRNAVDKDDPENALYGKIVYAEFQFLVSEDKVKPVPAADAYDEVRANLSLFAELPLRGSDYLFTAPKFTDNVDAEYALKYGVAYKYESSTVFTKSSSLSVSITTVGTITYRYYAIDTSGNESDYTTDNTPEFKVTFRDVTSPTIQLSTTTYTVNLNNYFTVPTPSIYDNSSSGGSLISTTLFDDKGNEIELNDDRTIKMTEVSEYIYKVTYEAKDASNNIATTTYTISVTVQDPSLENRYNALIVVLIVVGSLSACGIVAILLIKPKENYAY